jgi:hypothetical protein
MYGMVINVSVLPENMARIVCNVQLLDIGILVKINVYVIVHLFGMIKIVFVLLGISCIKVDVQNVLKDLNGLIISVKSVIVLLKTLRY